MIDLKNETTDKNEIDNEGEMTKRGRKPTRQGKKPFTFQIDENLHEIWMSYFNNIDDSSENLGNELNKILLSHTKRCLKKMKGNLFKPTLLKSLEEIVNGERNNTKGKKR